MAEYLLGFDIGGTKCAVNLGRMSEHSVKILDREAFPTDTSRGSEHALLRFEELARAMIAKAGIALSDVHGLGISCGGPLDGAKGLIINPPNLPGWENTPIVARFTERLGIPTALQNDADACALAEWRWGAGKGVRNMIFLTFGTGLGAGLILDGKLYTGARNLAGEVGHVRLADDGPVGYGKAGSFEGFCSGGGIARLAQATVARKIAAGETVAFAPADLAALTAADVFTAARQGDTVALEVVAVVARSLGRGLAMLVDILNPDAIVIGSIFARAHDLLWPLAEQTLREEALSLAVEVCRVVPAALGDQIGDYACLSIAAGV